MAAARVGCAAWHVHEATRVGARALSMAAASLRGGAGDFCPAPLL